MTQQLYGRGVLSLRAADKFMAGFQQIFAPFCVLLAEICIFLFFHISASKFQKLLITANAANTNQIQREFDSNVAIATFEFSLASKHLRQKTNLLKPFSAPLLLLPLRSGATCCHFARSRGKAEMGDTSCRRHKPNPKGIFV
jgi:hypothetical protein